MQDKVIDKDLTDFVEVRKIGADYDEHQKAEGDFNLKIDLENYVRFPRVDDNVTYKKTLQETRWNLQPGEGAELPDYSGPFRGDLRFIDFSREALLSMLNMSYEYYALCIGAWAEEIRKTYGEELMVEIQTSAWNDSILPQMPRILEEWWGFEVPADQLPVPGGRDVITFSPFKPDERYDACDKERLVKLALGSHEFLLLVIENWAAHLVLRFGLDEMFAIQWNIWSEKALPGARALKIKWMNVTGGDSTPVESFMKDIQVDATSFPGKAFEMTFEMPDRDTGIMTFNKCCAVDQWEALGRPDILEKNCHSTCPKSLIETAKMYDPNMKIDILAIPPRKDKGDVCCKWKLSMREPSDPDYIAVG